MEAMRAPDRHVDGKLIENVNQGGTFGTRILFKDRRFDILDGT